MMIYLFIPAMFLLAAIAFIARDVRRKVAKNSNVFVPHGAAATALADALIQRRWEMKVEDNVKRRGTNKRLKAFLEQAE